MSAASSALPPAWTSPIAAGIGAAVVVAAAVGSGLLALLTLLAIPAALVGFRAGWQARSRATPQEASASIEPPQPAAALPEPVAIHEVPPPEPRQWVDEAALLERMGGSVEILRELTALFAEENVRRLADLRAALAAGDPTQVSREAHGIKSGLTNFCAEEAVELAFQIEESAKKGGLEGLSAATDVLEVALQEVTEQLTVLGRAA